MSQRGGGRGNRGGRRPDYGRGQPQSFPGGSTSRGGPVGRGRGGPAYGSPSSSYSNPPPPAPAPAIPAPIPAQPEALATEIQQLLVQPAAKQGMPPSSSKALVIPPRPGFGTRGEKCFVKANHFLVQLSDKDIHHYDVSISPEISMKKLNREIVSELVKTYKESHLGRRIPAYDGMKSLYTAGALPFESKEFVINLKNNDNRGASSTKARRERKFTVTIKLAAKPDLYTLQLFLAKRHHDCPQEVIQALDVVLRAPQMLKESTVVVGRSFFSKDSGHKGNLGGGVDYWLGYYQSLRPAQMGLSLNIDLTARSFYEPVPVSEFIAKYLNLRDLNRPLSDQDRMKVKKALRGLKVEITHREYAGTYKVTGISREQLHRLKFPLDDNKGTTMTVVQYFREKYNIILRNTSLPALQAGSEAKPVYLPMEVCKIVKGQRYTKKLNKRQVATLLKATCRRPRDRENDIGEVSRNCQFSRDAIVSSEFGIHVGERLTRVHARVLPPPQLKYHDSGRDKQVTPDMGAWNMIQKKMVNGGRVQSWGCVNFSSGVDERLQSEFVHQLLSMCVSKGMEFNPHPAFPMMYGRQIDKTLIDIHNKCKTLQLLIIILPDESGSYGKIKRICETELGIVSQCCQPEQVQKLNKQYMENVSLKMNVKVGGRNTVLVDAIQRRIPIVCERPTIIFGADVTHPSPGEDSSPSIAAVVASMDWPEVTKYRGLVSAQSHREEIIEDLFKTNEEPSGPKPAGMIRDLLRAFFKSTGQKPHRIIFYRDGVSEGQFNQVLLHEVNNIRKACNSIEEGYMPPITFVVVQKRHHTRLFPDEHTREKTDRSGNIKPGTVVDTEICHPTEFDFYLNSHAGIKGTSRPTHYHVLFDENNFSADALQVLTNNLCYTYARCTRSVSIVPPAYYAHLAAFRARYYIEGEFSDTASSAEGRTTVERTTAVRALPVIKDNVKDVMFYC